MVIPTLPSESEYERFLLRQIHEIHVAAQEAAKPFVDALVRLRNSQPLPHLFVSREQAEELGLIGHD